MSKHKFSQPKKRWDWRKFVEGVKPVLEVIKTFLEISKILLPYLLPLFLEDSVDSQITELLNSYLFES
jgi:hypothetical protein